MIRALTRDHDSGALKAHATTHAAAFAWKVLGEPDWAAMLVCACLMIACPGASVAQPGEEALPPPVYHAPTSRDEVLSANPIQLRVSKDAPASELPVITGSLSLEDSVKRGLANNLTLKQSERSWDVSRLKARAALAKLGPSASFSGFFAKSSIDQMLFFMPDEIAAPPMQPITRNTSLHFIFAGAQPLFTGGRLLGGYKAARAQERQTLAGFRAERIATALKVKEAYWEAAWNEATLRVNADYVKYREWSTGNMRARMEQGKVPRADYLREEAELSAARAELNNAYRAFNASLVKLKVAMGVNLASQIDLKDALEYADTPHDLDFYLSEARRNRPEIGQAESKIQEMRAKKLVAMSRYAPQVTLFGLGSNATGSTPGVDETVHGRWGGLIAIVGGVTLFDSGGRLNELRAAGAALKQAQIGKQDTELKVAQDVSLAWIDLDLARRNVDLARAEVTSAEEDHRLLHARYMVGKAIALEDFDAAVKVYRARLALLEAIYKYRVAQARLIWASGSV